MEKLTLEDIAKIFENDEDDLAQWKGDNAFQGLLIIAKYFDPSKNNIIQGAGHDVIYSVDPQVLIDAGMDRSEFEKLADLN